MLGNIMGKENYPLEVKYMKVFLWKINLLMRQRFPKKVTNKHEVNNKKGY